MAVKNISFGEVEDHTCSDMGTTNIMNETTSELNTEQVESVLLLKHAAATRRQSR